MGKGYRKREVQISAWGGHDVRAFTYYADSEHVDATLRPYTWYRKHVLVGAEEAALPGSYVDRIKGVEARRDPDLQRENEELAIYRDDAGMPPVADDQAC